MVMTITIVHGIFWNGAGLNCISLYLSSSVPSLDIGPYWSFSEHCMEPISRRRAVYYNASW